ncbi:MAG: HD domain-containing protein, partial [Pseudomonadota bacterium]
SNTPGGSEMEVVSFYRMADGTREDYELLERKEAEFQAHLPQRILNDLRALGEDGYSGYHITRLEHSLQSATRALRDGREEDYVVACLLHDIGDLLAPWSHGELASSILKPFVSERIYWVIRYHPVFQYYYYGQHIGQDPNARERFRDSPYFDDCAEFCELYDQNCFDPTYKSESLAFFEPMLRKMFGTAPSMPKP